jgi:superfamily II DNA or RNA helicase
MQKMTPGTIVRVRRERWRITDVRPYDDCQVITVTGITPGRAESARHFLTPFDLVVPVGRRSSARGVRGSPWRRACRALVAADAPPGCLQTAVRAGIDLLPHQLAPALAIVRGLGCRILLADEVGLGKTVQAGLIVSELRAGGAVDRVLVLTPAGLRDQWLNELRARFGIDAAIADAAAVRVHASTLPAGVNPWTAWPIAIASLDYVKRADVLAAVAACRWDVVIVDEAHNAAADSDRHHAVRALAARASYVLLLTATPHSGDERTFESLCAIGDIDRRPILTFRRSRADAGIAATRRLHTLRVTPTAAERRMHRLLRDYADAVASEHGDLALALSVLQKRALSSAWALAESVERRLRVLDPIGAVDGEQLALPLDLQGELTADDEAPPWPAEVRLADVDRDRRLLRTIGAAARSAAGRESKVAALTRLLRRVAEPVLVFTEYRDTLRHVASAIDRPLVLLHGGMAADERRDALYAFRHGTAIVMLATDAAGEGLNFHDTCRFVINLELPWNPIRLEQRIGRVDRIGQRRRVHAVQLVAAGTAEIRLLDRLRARETAAHDAIATPAPEIRELNAHAGDEAIRLRGARMVMPSDAAAILGRLDATGPWITTPRGRWRRAVPAKRIELWRVNAEDEDGRLAGSKVLALVCDVERSNVLDALAQASHEWRGAVRIHAFASPRARLAREEAIVAVAAANAPDLYQPGLFDRRSERARLIADTAGATASCALDERRVRVQRQQNVTFRPPELLLVLAAP